VAFLLVSVVRLFSISRLQFDSIRYRRLLWDCVVISLAWSQVLVNLDPQMDGFSSVLLEAIDLQRESKAARQILSHRVDLIRVALLMVMALISLLYWEGGFESIHDSFPQSNQSNSMIFRNYYFSQLLELDVQMMGQNGFQHLITL
jgi:hypothetical protein